jgi:hypothetical protein
MKRYQAGLWTLAFAGALLASTAALAGFRSGEQVYIYDIDRLAHGHLGYVHNTADNTQYIGCYSNQSVGSCYARDSAGLTRSCTTSDANHIATIRSLSSDSSLYFWWDSSGYCTNVHVNIGSSSSPKR